MGRTLECKRALSKFLQGLWKYLNKNWLLKVSYFGRNGLVLVSSPYSILGWQYPEEGVKGKDCQSTIFLRICVLVHPSDASTWCLQTV